MCEYICYYELYFNKQAFVVRDSEVFLDESQQVRRQNEETTPPTFMLQYSTLQHFVGTYCPHLSIFSLEVLHIYSEEGTIYFSETLLATYRDNLIFFVSSGVGLNPL
jgi:hypothetical protein